MAGRAPEKKHRRWASHRCPAVVALEAAQKKRQARRAFRPVCRHRKGSSYQCPGLKAALKPDKISALFRRSDVRAHVVAEGLDTLWLYTTHPIRPGGLARLAELLGRALETKAKVPVELAGVELHVQPKRLAASKVLLSNDFFDVMVAPLAEGDDEARARVECRAQGLWAMGWERCAQKAVELLEVLCGADAAALDVQVARADLCVDVQGWTPTVEDRPFFHTRARSKGRYYGTLVKEWDSDAWVELEVARLSGLDFARRIEQAKSVSEWREIAKLVHKPLEAEGASDFDSGRRFTGFAFGLGGAISGRVYDKTVEIGKARKGWMRAVWREAFDYVEGRDQHGREEQHVWRVEVQVRREALREFQPDATSPLENLGAWEQLKAALPRLWRYGVRRWLRHGRKQTFEEGGKKVTRFVPSRVWRTVVDGFTGAAEAVEGLHREAVSVKLEASVPQLVGYASQVGAHLVESGRVEEGASFGELMQAVLRAAYDHQRGALQAKTTEKREGLRARRRLLERHAVKKPHRAVPSHRDWVRYRSEPVRFVPGVGMVGGVVRQEGPREVGW